jgi:hypothetical protein
MIWLGLLYNKLTTGWASMLHDQLLSEWALLNQMHPSWACCMIRLYLAEFATFLADPSLAFRIMLLKLPIKNTNLPKILYKSGNF